MKSKGLAILLLTVTTLALRCLYLRFKNHGTTAAKQPLVEGQQTQIAGNHASSKSPFPDFATLARRHYLIPLLAIAVVVSPILSGWLSRASIPVTLLTYLPEQTSTLSGTTTVIGLALMAFFWGAMPVGMHILMTTGRIKTVNLYGTRFLLDERTRETAGRGSSRIGVGLVGGLYLGYLVGLLAEPTSFDIGVFFIWSAAISFISAWYDRRKLMNMGATQIGLDFVADLGFVPWNRPPGSILDLSANT